MQDKRECYGWRSRRETGADPQWCIGMVNLWTRVRHLKELRAVVVQDSHRVKAGLLQLNPTIPFVDNDAYVDRSDVSLAGYICTHVA